MNKYYLVRPGVSLVRCESVNTPEYPFRFEKPKVGDTVWVIVKNDEEDYRIDTDTIKEVSDFYDIRARDYAYRKSILAGEVEWPLYKGEKVEIVLGFEPEKRSEYLIDFWLNKYRNGHANCFGETLYTSFEEARSVLVQLFTHDYTIYNEVLKMTEDQLKPD